MKTTSLRTRKPRAKRQRGANSLRALHFLLGLWHCESDSPRGRVSCEREFRLVLGGRFIEMRAHWTIGRGARYEEIALFGRGLSGKPCVVSFTSDGLRSEGQATDAREIHARAVGFESQMPAGLARQIWWPLEEGGLAWIVEARTRTGWRRFVEHHYRPDSRTRQRRRP